MHYSNVQLYDSATQQPVRVVFKYDEAGSLVRVKKSAGAAPSAGDVLPWPTEDDEEVSDLGEREEGEPEG